MFNLRVAVIFTILAVAVCEKVIFKSCPDDAGNCVVNEVRIDPCPEANDKKPCKIKRGKSADIEFDFTPSFSADTMEGRVYWASEIDLPLAGMDTDACKFTTCPLVKDQKQTYKFSLPIAKKFPANTYDIKWRLTSKDEKECCFITAIELKR